MKSQKKKWSLTLITALTALGLMGCVTYEGGEEKPAKKEVAAVEKEKAADVEKEEKPKKEETEKDYYANKVQPKIDSAIKEYDDIWTALWTPTFTALGEGNADAHGAYGSMKQLELKYKELMATIDDIEGKKLSKTNKKSLNEFKKEFKQAAMMRKAGGEEARKMIDAGTFSPSEIDKVMSTVQIADKSVIRALGNKLDLETTLGIIE